MRSVLWSSCVIVFGLIALTIDGGSLAADEDEEKVAIDNLPRAVVDAVKQMFPKAEMTGATKEQEEKLLGQAMNRPLDGGTTFVTGGDVSRFQRRTVPVAPMGMNRASAPMSAPAAASAFAAVPQGPVVRVTRGKNTVVEQVGRR